jgi:hypothetical protein
MKGRNIMIKLTNTKYGVLNVPECDKIDFAYRQLNYKNIALLGLILGIIGLFLFTAFRGMI